MNQVTFVTIIDDDNWTLQSIVPTGPNDGKNVENNKPINHVINIPTDEKIQLITFNKADVPKTNPISIISSDQSIKGGLIKFNK